MSNPKKLPSNQESNFYDKDPSPVTLVKEPYKEFFSWQSPIRPFQKKSKEYFTNLGALFFLVCIILLFLNQIGLILTILALAFLYYILNTVKPENTQHKLTTKGIQTSDKKYSWDQLGRFWFEKKNNQNILYIENFLGLPNRLMLLFDKNDKIQIKKILQKRLIHEKPELTQLDKASNWLSEKFIFESTSNQEKHNSKTSDNPKK